MFAKTASNTLTNSQLRCVSLLCAAMSPQMLGRGLRIMPGKTDCLVLDFTDEYNQVRRQHADHINMCSVTQTLSYQKMWAHPDMGILPWQPLVHELCTACVLLQA